MGRERAALLPGGSIKKTDLHYWLAQTAAELLVFTLTDGHVDATHHGTERVLIPGFALLQNMLMLSFLPTYERR